MVDFFEVPTMFQTILEYVPKPSLTISEYLKPIKAMKAHKKLRKSNKSKTSLKFWRPKSNKNYELGTCQGTWVSSCLGSGESGPLFLTTTYCTAPNRAANNYDQDTATKLGDVSNFLNMPNVFLCFCRF